MGREILIESHLIENLNERNHFLKGRENKISFLIKVNVKKNIRDVGLERVCNNREKAAYNLRVSEGRSYDDIVEILKLQGKNPNAHARKLVSLAAKKLEKYSKDFGKKDWSFIDRYCED